jgi:hypothetical protein
VTPELPFWPTSLQALASIASPRLGLQQIKSKSSIHTSKKYYSTKKNITLMEAAIQGFTQMFLKHEFQAFILQIE